MIQSLTITRQSSILLQRNQFSICVSCVIYSLGKTNLNKGDSDVGDLKLATVSDVYDRMVPDVNVKKVDVGD